MLMHCTHNNTAPLTSSNGRKLPLLPRPRRDRMLLLPGILINIILSTMLAHLIPDKLQSRDVKSHLVLLPRQDPTQRRPDTIQHGLHHFTSDDLAVVRQIADEVVVMQHGKLVEHATTDEVFDHPKKQYTRDLLDAIPGGKLQLGLD